MKLVLITSPYDAKFEADTINRLFREGLHELHLRKPDFDNAAMKKLIGRIDSEYHHKLVLHSHYSLVNTFDIHKIHLGHERMINFATDLYLDRVVLKGKKVLKSLTIAHCDFLYKTKGINEFMLGPVFDNPSFNVSKQLIPTAELENILHSTSLPVIALGGVTLQTLEFFKTLGFGSFIEMRDHQHSPAEYKLRIAV
jgi:thiamine monophosphate synthase